MQPSPVDIIGKIQQMYMEGRPVPYRTFMNVFNDLLADREELEPRKPSQELSEEFRAACMAANVGLVDPEGRGEQRVREFRENVYPAWTEELAPEEAEKYEEIITGQLRQRLQDEERQEREAAAAAADARSRELLAKLGIELEEEPEAAEPEPAPELPISREVARRFESINELCSAIGSGRLPVEYQPRGQADERAVYPIDSVDVALKLAEADGRQYTVLRAHIGRAALEGSQTLIDDFAAEMGYVRMADFAYMRRDQEHDYTLKVGSETTSAASATTETAEEDDVMVRIQTLHRDLGEMVERIQQA